MKQIVTLLESFRSDFSYNEFAFWNPKQDGMWHTFPRANVFLSDSHAAVVLHGNIYPGGELYVSFKLFYPDQNDPTGRPWENLVRHLETSAGLSRDVAICDARASKLLDMLGYSPDRLRW